MREKLKDLVEAAPDMGQEHWDDLAELLRRRVSLQAFLRNMLVIAQDRADTLVNISIATGEGQEQNALARGAASALQSYVAAACSIMGDAHEEELEVAEEARQEATGRRTTRTRKKPVRKQLRKRK